MDLSAQELNNRVIQEGIEYALTNYFSPKDLKSIKNSELKLATQKLIYALEDFQDVLEDATWQEITNKNNTIL